MIKIDKMEKPERNQGSFWKSFLGGIRRKKYFFRPPSLPEKIFFLAATKSSYGAKYFKM